VGKLNFWLMFIGFNLAFGPMHVLGLQGMPRRIYVYPEGMGWDLWNLVSTVGAFTIGLSVLVFILNAVVSRARGEEAGADPWDARTIEWSTSSPPPEYNFAQIPLIRRRDDFWHRKYTEEPEETERVFAGGAGDNGIHMPDPSYFPLIGAIGIPLMAWGVIHNPALIAVGALIALFGLFGWAFEPSSEEH
jgi:cytochrome c oxidase subunit I